MCLKLKAKFYRLTGIYLAQGEEDAHVNSDEFFKELSQHYHHPRNDMRIGAIRGMLIGLWQYKHGFYRRYRPSRLFK